MGIIALIAKATFWTFVGIVVLGWITSDPAILIGLVVVRPDDSYFVVGTKTGEKA